MKTHSIFTLYLAVVLGLILIPAGTAQADESEAWEALREGRAVLMLRHALAPGTGDPGNFEVDDCSTQRNLNDRGREQARAWKPLLAEHGITEARVFSSQWCRCLETAREMDVGPVEEMTSLNSFFRNRGNGPMQTEQTIAIVNELEPGLPVVLVSHQVNVTALTDVFPSSNEGVIIALPLSGNPTVLAKVSPGR
ncbi:histidine phosphatase family protein [Marinobacter orientalis]|uniref:Histidine phosphatase family protein n=1 Tax=Marinobacter orientalis TaxID=1928859 RepID=A0A7Y0RDI3_9GAMM|nr:histidine phosphatase family protein [Marinobacter orientalis]NMT64220.1 histidine phosphatase family protein [Marinobacter orientalis]TGX49444.1 histidine phosphatase family protein [Marinobacter orientalis]